MVPVLLDSFSVNYYMTKLINKTYYKVIMKTYL